MDALADFRRAHGLPALSINWGPWAEVGAAVTLGVSARLASQGFRAITPTDGLAALDALLQMPRDAAPSHIGVMPMDWPTYFRQAPGRVVPRLSSLVERPPAASVPSPLPRETAAPAPDVVAAVKAAPQGERRALLLRAISGRIAESLGLRGSDTIEAERPLEQLGLDSLLAVEVRGALGLMLGASLPATLLFDYPTLDKVTDYLGRHVLDVDPWRAAAEAPRIVEAPHSDDPLSLVEDLDDEAVDRLLAARSRDVN
jgi:acyl carrier protein